jgi:hypothetical protein
MLRLWIRNSVLCTLLLTALNWVSVKLGVTQPLPQTARGFSEGCAGQPGPCWYGILPEETLMSQAGGVITRQGYITDMVYPDYAIYRGVCAVELEGLRRPRRVYRIYLHNCKGLLLGDILAQTGPPRSFVFGGRTHLWLRLNAGEVYLALPSRERLRAWLYLPVERVWLFRSSLTPPPGWHGFAPLWRYCQLAPGGAGCS